MPLQVWHGALARIALVFLVSTVLFAQDAEGNASAGVPPSYADETVSETGLVETMSTMRDVEKDALRYIASSEDDLPEEDQFLSETEQKEAAATAKTAKDLAALKKSVAAKKASSQKHLKAQSAALQHKLAADKLKLKAAQQKVSKSGAATVAVTAPKAAADPDVVGPKLLSTITKLQKKLKDVMSQNEKDLTTKVEAVKTTYEGKLKDLNEKLKREQRSKGRVAKRLEKDKAKTAKAKTGMKQLKARKDVRKKQYHDAKHLIRKLTDVTKRMRSKFMAEHALRKKAIASVTVLQKRIETMSHFGKKAAKFAKKQALRAAAIKKKASKDTKALLAKQTHFVSKANAFEKRKDAIKGELAKIKAEKVAAEAKALHEKTERRKLHLRFVQLHTNLTQAQRHAGRLTKKVIKHKKIAKKAATKVMELKEEAHKAVLALHKVNAIRMALKLAKKELAHYKQENKLQRMELAQAAVEELKAANVTKLAAHHAEAMEEHALQQRNLERKIVKEAQDQVTKGHEDLEKVREFAKNLVSQAQIQLVQEHTLRTHAERDLAHKQTNVGLLKAALLKEHETRLREADTARELRKDRDRLLAREKAEARMIAIEKEATEESNLALANFKKAAARKEAELKARFQAALAKEHAALASVKTNAAAVAAHSHVLQQAVEVEKKVLAQDHEKEAQERASWQQAMAAVNKERIARKIAEEKAASSSRHLTEQAQSDVGTATTLASSKEAQLEEVQAQLKEQARKFAEASTDWGQLKSGLEQSVEKAREDASQANSKLAEYMKRREEDSTGAVAAGSMKAAMAKAEKAAAAKEAANEVMALLQEEKEAHESQGQSNTVVEAEVPPELEMAGWH